MLCKLVYWTAACLQLSSDFGQTMKEISQLIYWIQLGAKHVDMESLRNRTDPTKFTADLCGVEVSSFDEFLRFLELQRRLYKCEEVHGIDSKAWFVTEFKVSLFYISHRMKFKTKQDIRIQMEDSKIVYIEVDGCAEKDYVWVEDQWPKQSHSALEFAQYIDRLLPFDTVPTDQNLRSELFTDTFYARIDTNLTQCDLHEFMKYIRIFNNVYDTQRSTQYGPIEITRNEFGAVTDIIMLTSQMDHLVFKTNMIFKPRKLEITDMIVDPQDWPNNIIPDEAVLVSWDFQFEAIWRNYTWKIDKIFMKPWIEHLVKDERVFDHAKLIQNGTKTMKSVFQNEAADRIVKPIRWEIAEFALLSQPKTFNKTLINNLETVENCGKLEKSFDFVNFLSQFDINHAWESVCSVDDELQFKVTIYLKGVEEKVNIQFNAVYNNRDEYEVFRINISCVEKYKTIKLSEQ